MKNTWAPQVVLVVENPSTNAGDAREPGSLGWEDPPKNAWVTEHSKKIDALAHDTVLLSLVLFSRQER